MKLLAGLLAVLSWADTETVARMAAALAEDNPEAFMKPIDPKMPGYEELKANIKAILQQAEVTSSISPLSEDEFDWYLELKRRGNDLQIERRRQIIRVKMEPDGKKWKVVGLEPQSFFAPPQFR